MIEPLLTSLIAAGSALLGATIPQVFSWLGKRQERKHETLLLRRAKLEEIAGLAVLFVAYTNESLFQSSRQKEGQSSPIEWALRIHMLALLYFPAMKTETEIFYKACLTLDIALRENNGEKALVASPRLKAAKEALELAIEHQSSALN